MTEATNVVQVWVPGPFRGPLDYLKGPAEQIDCGQRVRVPLGKRSVVGVVAGQCADSQVNSARLKPVEKLLDTDALLAPDLIRLLTWASNYYQHPPGDVLAAALPVNLRKGELAQRQQTRYWQLTEKGLAMTADALKSAPRQSEIMQILGDGEPHPQASLPGFGSQASVLKRLCENGWVRSFARPASPDRGEGRAGPALTEEQAQALSAMPDEPAFLATLLEGVTGSGKTELYLALARRVLARGQQVLVLVPEIGLTPQLVSRFFERLDAPIVVLHSGLSDGERCDSWLAARDGDASVVLGTRSAIFTPMPKLGLIIVDEEHDGSFKQHDGFRYSARDLAVRRAQMADIPIVLGSATPSLESLNNAKNGRYGHVGLSRRVGAAGKPRLKLLDIRSRGLQEGLSQPLLQRTGEHLQAGGQVLMFLNRRGFAPVLLCHDCGWQAPCRDCDSAMTLHGGGRRLRCHHCGASRPPPQRCEQCGSASLIAIGEGTERIAGALRSVFPDVPMARFDRDSTTRKGALAELLERVRSGELRLLVGTQMIAKGHDFPDLSLVGVVNADGGLFSTDFRAIERMAQLVTQVAGRAGRDSRPGEVIIQTHHPDHPLLKLLVEKGYPAFAEAVLEERRMAGLPPFGSLALLQAEARKPEAPQQFLSAAFSAAEDLVAPAGPFEVERWGPAPAPMERRAGRTRAHLLLRADSRQRLQQFLRAFVPRLDGLAEGRRVRWALDVDPQDLI